MTRNEQVYTYTVELVLTEPDRYSVRVPALPGVVTSGGTVEEALAMARDAITLHLEGLREDGLEIPIEPPSHRRRRVRVPIEVAALAAVPAKCAVACAKRGAEPGSPAEPTGVPLRV